MPLDRFAQIHPESRFTPHADSVQIFASLHKVIRDWRSEVRGNLRGRRSSPRTCRRLQMDKAAIPRILLSTRGTPVALPVA
jgi:hypothetical protein